MTANAFRGVDIRAQARSGLLVGPTCGLAPDYLQANLVIVRRTWPLTSCVSATAIPNPAPSWT
jgi:uncharacterized protein YcsI (UPF0317 family)